MAVTQYIGARYVPVFADPLEWSSTKQYEPLTIVLHEGNSYTSRQFVPVGVEITNTSYWVLTGNYNAQVEQYRRETVRFTEEILGKMQVFDTVSEMKQSPILREGMKCKTMGFNTINDGGGAFYEIVTSATPNEMDVIKCGDYYATLIVDDYITPEMLGCTNPAIDCSAQLNHMFSMNCKHFVLPNTYTISNTVEITVNDSRIDFGEIHVTPKNGEQGFGIKFVNCTNVIINNLNIYSENIYTTMLIPGMTPVLGSISSNINAIQIIKCSKLTFTDINFNNMLRCIWFTNGEYEYTINSNDNIIINNMTCKDCHEGIHSNESTSVQINGFIFDGITLPSRGYHGFYLERNTHAFTIKNLTANIKNGGSVFFDLADSTNDVTNPLYYQQEFTVIDAIIKAPLMLAFRYKNNYAKFVNVTFIINQAIASPYYLDGLSDSTNYPKIEFSNCQFEMDPNISGYTPEYVRLANDNYIRDVKMEGCDICFSLSNGFNGTFKAYNCHFTAGGLRLFISDGGGTVSIYNSVFDIPDNSYNYALGQRVTNITTLLYNCIFNFACKYFMNNANLPTNISFMNCYMNNPDALGFTVDTVTTGQTYLNSYFNGNLIEI